MTHENSYRGPPMTLANMRENGVLNGLRAPAQLVVHRGAEARRLSPGDGSNQNQ
jgi:hypothetical protein